MINFENGEFHTEPYPYIIVDNCFDNETLKKLKDEFPNVENRPQKMGNRKKLESPDATKWLRDSPSWNSFYNWMDTDDTFKSVMNMYNTELSKWNTVLNNKSSLSTDCYVYIDWSVAGDGYVREVHCDRNIRIWNFIIFLSDKDWDGGDFIIHSSKGFKNLPRRIYNKSLPVVRTIEAKANRGLFFLSTPNSYHSVSKQSNTKSPRKFIYGSYSSKLGNVFKGKRNAR